ncbi:MAG TPA: hypothetical protein VII13_05970 [Vicinamibacteria bacterium]
MQANCPGCGQRLTVDDNRAPEKPFNVKCPRCQSAVRFPGRLAAAPAPADADSGGGLLDLGRVRRELASDTEQLRQVLVGLNDSAQADAVTQPLTQLGFSVEALDTPEEGGRLIEQGLFDVVVTSPSYTVAKGETVLQRINRLAPDQRRRMFLVLVGDQFKTGDAMQAFVAQADLVIHPSDVASSESILLNTMAERRRLYRPFTEARKRLDAD